MITAERAAQFLTDAGFEATAELVRALQQACQHRHESRASNIINHLGGQQPDEGLIGRINEEIDLRVARIRRPR